MPMDASKRYTSRPRMPGFDYTGRYAYHVTFVSDRRRPQLLAYASEIIAAIDSVAATAGFDVLAYVVMPDHLHVLVLGNTDDSNLIRFAQRFKQRTAFDYKRRAGEQLWQPSFHDHALRSNEDLVVAARYIAGG